MKLSWKSYWKPTPKRIRKLADAILAGATLASTYSHIVDYPKVGIAIMVVSVIAKILSNFLEEEDTSDKSS